MRFACLILIACGSSAEPEPPAPQHIKPVHKDAAVAADAGEHAPDNAPPPIAIAITVRTKNAEAIELAGAIPQTGLGACFAASLGSAEARSGAEGRREVSIDTTPVALGFDVTAKGTTDRIVANKPPVPPARGPAKEDKVTACIAAAAKTWELPPPAKPTHVEVTIGLQP